MADDEDRRAAEHGTYTAAVNGAYPDGVNAVLPAATRFWRAVARPLQVFRSRLRRFMEFLRDGSEINISTYFFIKQQKLCNILIPKQYWVMEIYRTDVSRYIAPRIDLNRFSYLAGARGSCQRARPALYSVCTVKTSGFKMNFFIYILFLGKTREIRRHKTTPLQPMVGGLKSGILFLKSSLSVLKP
jgi:hypothetical protein